VNTSGQPKTDITAEADTTRGFRDFLQSKTQRLVLSWNKHRLAYHPERNTPEIRALLRGSYLIPPGSQFERMVSGGNPFNLSISFSSSSKIASAV
jgi:hypothetical protein